MADSRILLVSNFSIIKAVWKVLKNILSTVSTFFQIGQTKNFIAISPLRTFKALNFSFQIQGRLKTFKFCPNTVKTSQNINQHFYTQFSSTILFKNVHSYKQSTITEKITAPTFSQDALHKSIENF